MSATTGLASRRASRRASRHAARHRAGGGAARPYRPALLLLARGYLVVLSAAGALSLLLALLAGAGVLRPLRVISDSMVPAFAAGDLVVATIWPTAWIEAGDIVVARSSRSDRLDIAHRVIATAPTLDGAELRLRGDANSAPDPEEYRVDRTVSRVWFSIPDGATGYAVLTSPPVGLPALGGLALLAILAATATGEDASRSRRTSARPRIRRGRQG